VTTESEASKKWCPFVRYSGEDGGSYNRHAHHEKGIINNPEQCRCIASQCMAWRWYVDEEGNDLDHSFGGFCGLAGKS